jgi:hypothetical protein
MDYLPAVLQAISRALRPGAPFLLSVVTDRFLEWAALPQLAAAIGEPARARMLEEQYERYHHHVNPLPPATWAQHLVDAGFYVDRHIPILPEMTSRLFLFLDHLWHVPRPDGELGGELFAYLQTVSRFPEAFRNVLVGVLQMESDWTTGSGAVFQARKLA